MTRWLDENSNKDKICRLIKQEETVLNKMVNGVITVEYAQIRINKLVEKIKVLAEKGTVKAIGGK